MKKPNYGYERHKKEMERKKKQEEKRKRKLENANKQAADPNFDPTIETENVPAKITDVGEAAPPKADPSGPQPG